MKKFHVIMLIILLFMNLPTYQESGDARVEFTSMWPAEGTITVGESTYAFSRERNLYNIAYPDGTKYIVEKRVGGYIIRDEAGENIAGFSRPWGSYTDPFSLVMDIQAKKRGSIGRMVGYIQKAITVLETAIGLCLLLAPKRMRRLEHGRKCGDMEPPPKDLRGNRLAGGLIVLLGAIVLARMFL